MISSGADIQDSMITDGCVIKPGAKVIRSILSPGVRIESGALIEKSIILTDTIVEAGASVQHTIIDKHVHVGEDARIGAIPQGQEPSIAMIGKNSIIPPRMIIEPGAVIGTDVWAEDFLTDIIRSDEYIQTKRQAYEV
jgi:glucose-1-phosphate adenylyltransferase